MRCLVTFLSALIVRVSCTEAGMLHKAGMLVLILTLAPSVESVGGEPSMEVPAALVLERFLSIAKGGDVVLVPLRLRNKEHCFHA